MKAYGVIGAAFGDEGKGKLTHCLAMQGDKPCIVVRYNGGAQAAHTVITDSGQGHIFHHYGSGTLAGAATYLSQFFLCNPLLWQPEYMDLLKKCGQVPKLYVHPNAPLTTPYDMLINREAERSRGANRHGSCGYGVNETVERLCQGTFPLWVNDIRQRRFEDLIKAIRDKWVPHRLRQLKIDKPTNEFVTACASPLLYDEFLQRAKEFDKLAVPMFDEELGTHGYKTVIFEGAQGLCLAEDHKFFPHVTRSRTGLPNIDDICTRAEIKEIDVVYVTRAYTTRHGYGPLPTEVNRLAYDDPTNVQNEWQGTMRFGHFDVDLIKAAIKDDLKKAAHVHVTPVLAITCMDQVGETVNIYYKDKIQQVKRDALSKLVANAIGAKRVYLSWKR